jgi:membrane fusion protein (multidrug efflux system)
VAREGDDDQRNGETATEQRGTERGSREDASNGRSNRTARSDLQEKRPFYKRPVPLIIGGLVLVGAAVGGLLWWLHARQFVSTDDAFISADVTHVAPQVSGRIIRVLINDNQEVKPGDLLAEINPPDFEVKLEQAKALQAEAESRLEQAKAQEAVAAANVEAARADVAANEASAANAAADLRRYQSLNTQSVSPQQLDQSAATAKTTAAQLLAAQRKLAAAEAQQRAVATDIRAAAAGVHSAEESVRQANINLGYTKITASVAGWVTNKSLAVGDYVQPGQQLLAIVPYDVWVNANFKETQLDRMQPGQPATIAADASPEHDLHGTVQSIQAGSGAAFSLLPPENATGNYVKVVQRVPVKIVFDKPPNEPGGRHPMGPGMSVVPRVKVR